MDIEIFKGLAQEARKIKWGDSSTLESGDSMQSVKILDVDLNATPNLNHRNLKR